MSKVQLQGNANGTGIFTIASPNSNTDRTLTLPDNTGTLLTSGSAISGTTGTFSGLIYANGGGVQFPATQVTSGDANCLDDYEEGTFTPTVQFGGASVGIVYGDRRAQYVKIGRNVFVNIYIYLNNKGSSTGQAAIAGFPFGTAAIDFFIPLGVRGNLNSGGEQVSLYSSSTGSTSFPLYKCNLTGGSNSTLGDSAFSNTTELNFNFWYQAAN